MSEKWKILNNRIDQCVERAMNDPNCPECIREAVVRVVATPSLGGNVKYPKTIKVIYGDKV